MKLLLFALLVFLSLNSYSQKLYPLGEKEFTQEKEEATTFTSYDEVSSPKLKDSIDLSFKLPPADNQGDKGSCWAWATAYAIRSVMDNQQSFLLNGKIDYSKVYSPEYVYQYYKGKISDCNWGAISSEMLTRILKDGVVKFSDFTYNDQTCDNQPRDELKKKAKQNIKTGYSVQTLNDLYSIKKVLNDNQPLVISIKVDDYFCTKGNITSSNPYWKNFGTRKGSHAMVVVGYNERLKSLKIMNSWGSEFGDKGFVWISYSIINSAMNYCCFPKKELENLPVTSNEKPAETDLSLTVNLDSMTTWFKEGYYRPFEKLKIVLAKLSTSQKFAVIEIRDEDYNLKTNFYIDIKSSKEFFVNGKKYKFTFDNIDKAGSNPFNKAVFFTVKTFD